MLWFIFAFASSICVAIINIITRRLKKLDNISLLYGRYLIGTLFALPLLFFTGIPKIKPDFYASIVVASLGDVVAVGLLIKAIQSADLSRTIPFLSFTPLFLILTGSLILGELPSLIGTLGIIIIVLGAYLLNLQKRSNFFSPFTRLVREKGSRYVLIAAFLFSLVGPALKKAVLNSSINFTIVMYFILSTAILTPFFVWNGNTRRQGFKENLILLIITGLALFLIMLTINLAFQRTLVAYAVSIKRLSILFTILLGYYFFKEKDLLKNVVAVSIMIVGAFLIAIGG